MEGPVTIDEFLASLGADNVHSSGAFTISEQAARDKLGRFTLVHPSLYVLELLSAAVLGGASTFEVSTPGGATHFRFDGTPLTVEECQQGLAHLFESSTRPRLSCLGLALSAARSLTGSRDLSLVLPSGTFLFDGAGLTLSGPPGPEGWSELQVPGRFGFVGGLFRKDASLKETLELGACAPLQLRLDGSKVSRPWKPEGYWTVAALLALKNPRFPLEWGHLAIKPSFSTSSPGEYSALLAMLPPEYAEKSGLTIVHHGVSYRTHDPDLAIPGFAAVVMCDVLNRNLSRSEIVWDEPYRNLTAELRVNMRLLVNRCMESGYRMNRAHRRCRDTVKWAQVERQSQVGGGVSHQREVWLKVDGDHQLRENPQALADKGRRLALQGNTVEAETYFLLALELLIEGFRAAGTQRNLAHNLRQWTALFQDLLISLKGNERAPAFHDLLALLDPLQDVNETSSLALRILHHRLKGETKLAADLLPRWTRKVHDFDYRVPAEVLMAIPRSEDALNALLRVMGCADVETALAKEWPAHRLRDIDLLADILEYRHDARSLQARQIGYGLADTEELRYLYCLELCRQSRGRGRFLDWVKLRATASMLSMSKAPGTLETLQKEMPDIAEVLEGKRTLPQDLDRFLVPLYDKLSTLTPMFTYFLGRVAHRLRMAGDHAGADLLLARAYALRAMDRALGTL